MIIDNVSITAIVLDKAANIRNAVIHNSIPFSIVMTLFFIINPSLNPINKIHTHMQFPHKLAWLPLGTLRGNCLLVGNCQCHH